MNTATLERVEDDFREVCLTGNVPAPAITTSAKHLYTWADVADMEPKPTKYHIRRWIPMGGYSLIAAEPGAGKSWLATSIGVAIATGMDWMGYRTTKGKVLYLAGEPKDDASARLSAYTRGTGIKPNDDLIIMDHGVRGIIDNGLDRLEAMVTMYDIDMVIFDPLVQCLESTSENDNQEVRECMDQLTRMLSQHKCDFIIVHHTAKSASEGVYVGRGAGDWGGGATSVIRVERKSGACEVSRCKRTNGLPPEPLILTLHEEWDERDDDDYLLSAHYTYTGKDAVVKSIMQSRIAQVMELLRSAGPLAASDIEARTGLNQSARKRVLADAGKSGLIYQPRNGVYAIAGDGSSTVQ